MTELARQRAEIRSLLEPSAAPDAMAVYYALHHDPARTRLFLYYTDQRRLAGFLVRAQTGFDLFRPLIVVRAPHATAVARLLQTGLLPGRPYYLTLPRQFGEVAFRELQVTEPSVLRLYELNAARFRPQTNVLVTEVRAKDGLPRYEIRNKDRQHAVAGVNWRSEFFAEIFVSVEQGARGRGWGRSVVSALTAALLRERLRPIYVTADTNDASIRLAESIGFVDTGVREFSCFAVRRAAAQDRVGKAEAAHG